MKPPPFAYECPTEVADAVALLAAHGADARLAGPAGRIGHVAHHQIRNRGTVGGSLAHNDPTAERPVVMLALDAEMSVHGPAGTRTVAAAGFFTDTMETALAADELLTEIMVPALPEGCGWSFREAARRQGDFALAAVCVLQAAAGPAPASWSPAPAAGRPACPKRRRSSRREARTAMPARRRPMRRLRRSSRWTTPTRRSDIGASSWRR